MTRLYLTTFHSAFRISGPGGGMRSTECDSSYQLLYYLTVVRAAGLSIIIIIIIIIIMRFLLRLLQERLHGRRRITRINEAVK